MLRPIFILVAFCLSSSPRPIGRWKLAQEARVQFSIRGLLGSTVNGTLKPGASEILFDPADPGNAGFSVSLDVSSLNTGIALRDHHLMNNEYFDAGRYPLIRFRSLSVDKKTDGRFEARGLVTLKGREKTLTIPYAFFPEGPNGRFKGGFTLNRLDFGIGGPSMNMGDIVTVTFDLPVLPL
jgi:polyisoprenoid-binding protein YceI